MSRAVYTCAACSGESEGFAWGLGDVRSGVGHAKLTGLFDGLLKLVDLLRGCLHRSGCDSCTLVCSASMCAGISPTFSMAHALQVYDLVVSWSHSTPARRVRSLVLAVAILDAPHQIHVLSLDTGNLFFVCSVLSVEPSGNSATHRRGRRLASAACCDSQTQKRSVRRHAVGVSAQRIGMAWARPAVRRPHSSERISPASCKTRLYAGRC